MTWMISGDDLDFVTDTITWLSIVGSLTMLLLIAAFYCKTERLESGDDSGGWDPKQREMLFWLSVCDLVTCSLFLIKPGTSNHNCMWGAPAVTFFSSAGCLWTDAIALDVWRTVKFRHVKPAPSFRVWCRIVCFGIPAILAVLQIRYNVSGVETVAFDNRDSCWIKQESRTDLMLWRMESGKAIEFLSVLFIPACYITAQWELRQLHLPLKIFAPISRRMTLVPAAFVFLRTPDTVHMLLWIGGISDAQIANNEQSLWQLLLLLESLWAGQGFANCLLYVFGHSQAKHQLPLLCTILTSGNGNSNANAIDTYNAGEGGPGLGQGGLEDASVRMLDEFADSIEVIEEGNHQGEGGGTVVTNPMAVAAAVGSYICG
jgi:hypothetical protein